MTTATLYAVRIDSLDAEKVARFWAGVLGWDVVPDASGAIGVVPADGTAYRLVVAPSDTEKVDQNRIHFDLTSTDQTAMDATVARVLELGGRHIDIGQTPDDGHVVMADPEGNELCVIEPGNNFLSDTGVIGGINCDGSQAVGYFWSKALDWPLVWDQDEETAIQSPAGGSKVTWSGPPLMDAPSVDRFRLELGVPTEGDLGSETQRLVSLGATLVDGPTSDGAGLLDPDGTAFRIVVTD